MSWVSQANIKTIMTAIRNKFTTSDLVIANNAKDTGVELNYASQDGLVTVSPISTSASTEAALHLSNGDDTKKTELTQGTLSYVTGTGSSETYNYMSLLGDGVTFGKNGGGNVQLGGVDAPTSIYHAVNKEYLDGYYKWYEQAIYTTPGTTFKAGETTFIGKKQINIDNFEETAHLIVGHTHWGIYDDDLVLRSSVYQCGSDKVMVAVFITNVSSEDYTINASVGISVLCAYHYRFD